MKQITITIPDKAQTYPIYIGQSILGNISELLTVNQYSKIVIITDEIVENLLSKHVGNSLQLFHKIIVQSGEQNKTIQSIQTIWKNLHALGCDRKSLLLNIGGGVIGDMGGFAASTYMRGIDFIQIPTTLLAAVDASIGGKTGIDFDEIKNLIGTIQQPAAVIIDTEIIKTLPKREFLNGFAEIIKHGLIKDNAYFELVTSKNPEDFTNAELIDIITRSCQIKKDLVEHDETEQGERKLVNFGHTIGHAIEALSWKTEVPLKHGEAIHIGMIAETNISNAVGLLSDEETKIIEDKLKHTGLPTMVKDIHIDEVLKKIASDKKNTQGTVNWTLLKHIGESVYDQNVDEGIVREAIKRIISS